VANVGNVVSWKRGVVEEECGEVNLLLDA